ncbi:MAG: cytoskeleton protein RodZ [Psychromonas sp.]|jgi:cytoskeleton protein RodZ|uniref:RodZ domain-containing protein n=1 Tax=Psychromonas sp. TaxID=1884585 RepID=UPI0039E690DF
MNTINNQEQTATAPLGKALQAARLAASLSIEEVAEQLNLGMKTVRDIEDDLDNTIENRKYAIIYLRGYLVNYAKLVGLDKLNQFIEYQQLSQSEKKADNLRAPMILPPPVKKRSKLLFVLLFIIVTVGLYLLVVQQDFFGETPLNPDNQEAEINLGSLSDEDSLNNTLQIFDDETGIDSSVEAAEQVNTDVELSATPETNATEDLITSNEVAVESGEIITQNAITTESLKLTFSTNCWTEISDSTGKRLAFDLYKAGNSLTVNGVAPFELKLGDPSGVQIQYQDKILNKEFISGSTARFSIPQ